MFLVSRIPGSAVQGKRKRAHTIRRLVSFKVLALLCPFHVNEFPLTTGNFRPQIDSPHSDKQRLAVRVAQNVVRVQLKCYGTRTATRFLLSAKRTSPLKSAGASVQSTTGNRGVRISGSNAGYTMFRVSVMGTGYPLQSLVSPSLPLPCVTVCHHISAGVYLKRIPDSSDSTTTML